MESTLYLLIFGAIIMVVHAECEVQPTNRAPYGQQPYRPPYGQQPYRPQFDGRPQYGQQPYRPQFDVRPQRPQSGQQPYRPPVDGRPQHPQSGQQPYRPQSGQQPYRPQSGQQPYRPQSGQQPYRPQSGQQPYRPPYGVRPQYPQSGVRPQHPQSGVRPQHPQSGVRPQHPQSGVRPQHPQSGQQPYRPQPIQPTNRQGPSNNKVDYCNLKSCASPRSHTLCRFSPEPHMTGPKCGTVKSSGMTDAEIKEVLDKHNELRAKVARGQELRGSPGPQPAATNLGPLKWNPELARMAQAWANQCTYEHDECHAGENGANGQNIGYSAFSNGYRTILADLVVDWYDEVEDFNGQEVKSFRGGGPFLHYSQMIWATTKEVGCGVVRFNHKVTSKGMDRTQLVCNYAPMGNWVGEPVYQTR